MNADKLAEKKEGKEEEYIPPVEVDEEESDDSEFESESSIDLEEEIGVTVRTVMG